MTDKRFSADVTLKRLTDEGKVQAVFSTQTIIDSDGDRVLASSFTDGQPVAMAAWGHNWGSLPPGRGVIRVEPTRAIFDGQFFVNTSHGRDAYETVKAMSAPPSIQEWSFGFRVLDSEPGRDGERVIKRVEVYEVSPVLIGSNRQSHTLAIKAGRAAGSGHHPDPLMARLRGMVLAARRPDPELAKLRTRFYADAAGRDRAALAEGRALLARFGEEQARERHVRADLAADLATTLARADRVLGRRYGGRR